MELQISPNAAKTPEGIYRIRFQDCDPFGHLNNARYVDYAFDAREDQLRRYYGFDIPKWTKTMGKGWVVSKMKVNYVKPILWNEEIKISTRLVDLKEGSLWVEALFFGGDNGQKLQSVLWGEFVYVDVKSGRPARHDADLKSFLESIWDKDEWFGKESIESRVQVLRSPVPA